MQAMVATKPGAVGRPGPFEPEEWTAEGICASDSNPDAWFEPINSAAGQYAASQCFACPMRLECLTRATERGEMHGIWGGVDFSEEEYCAGGHFKTDETWVNMPRASDPEHMQCVVCKREAQKAYKARRRAA